MDAKTRPVTLNVDEVRASVLTHLNYSMAKDAAHATLYDWRMALAFTLRDRIVDRWFESTRTVYREGRKRVYYLSAEFLIGRLIQDAVINLGLEDACRGAMEQLGLDYTTVVQDEPDAGLGNGGLGRLAACYMESMATLGMSAYGYGIRYEHGLFRQRFENGAQVEEAEDWLTQPHPWEFERPEVAYRIGFGGQVNESGGRAVWEPGEEVLAQAYDTPIIGWQGRWANTLRLWAAQPVTVFDLERFNAGDFAAAARPEALARTLSRVLYPNDTTEPGRELRLKQEYFFSAASVQDLLRRLVNEYGDIALLPEKVAIHMNDTHPALAAPELVRLLVDRHEVDMDDAIDMAHRCLAYTNHTLLPEALEAWPYHLFARVLPRHVQIIRAIEAWSRRRGRNVVVIDEGRVKMGELAFETSHRVNGVSALHTDLVRSSVFAHLHERDPDRIVNVTNGVTPRKWLYSCNQPLSDLITDAIGDAWITDLERLAELEPLAEDAAFRDRYQQAKRANKVRFSNWLVSRGGPRVDPEVMFDVHIKRIHEYKRQLMNVLETIALWNAMREDPAGDWTPRVKIFGGKAAPGYHMAKQIIRLIHDVAAVINADPAVRGRLTVVFPPNYNVSMAEVVIPAAELSEQISTAGMEASGTGNMKLALNGALTIGTLDGANIEIRERVGDEHFFLFGLTAQEAIDRRQDFGYGRAAIEASPRLRRALDQIVSGTFSPDEPGRYGEIVGHLWDHDYFLVTCDFDAYYAAQRRVDVAYGDRASWLRSAIVNTARLGWFSSDRAIREYAKQVWGV